MKRHRVGVGHKHRTGKAFNATIEFLGKGRALVSLTDQNGEWAGGHRIDVRSGRRDDLYEAGYTSASASAAAHGGRLESFRAL